MPQDTETPKKAAGYVYKIFIGLSIPVILGVYYNWLATRDTLIELNHAIEKIEIQHATLSMQLNNIQQEIDKGERFTRKEGDNLKKDIKNNERCCNRLSNARLKHDIAAEGWITTIKRNTAIILDNQRKSHTHNGRNP